MWFAAGRGKGYRRVPAAEASLFRGPGSAGGRNRRGARGERWKVRRVQRPRGGGRAHSDGAGPTDRLADSVSRTHGAGRAPRSAESGPRPRAARRAAGRAAGAGQD